ncbi:MAG: hypothetical protein AB3N63_03510 [Puniceicoccaceae bacterium]
MSNKYKVTKRKRGLYIQYLGKLSIEDALKGQAAFHGSENFDDQSYVIWDYRGCDISEITEADVDMLVAHHIGATHTLKIHKVAAVGEGPRFKMLFEHFKARCEDSGSPWEICMFSSDEEAMKWCRD